MKPEQHEQPQGTHTPHLVPLTEFTSKFGWPPLGGLRSMVFHGHKTGFSKCVRRVGRRVLIDVESFYKWVDEQNGIGREGEANDV